MSDLTPMTARYLHLKPGTTPPMRDIAAPYKAVVVIEDDVDDAWQSLVSDWLVKSGCRFMMAWGLNCSSWDDSVDHANLRMFGYGDIPDEDFVMTTWHEDEPLEETLWFAAHTANHPQLDVENTLIVHIASQPRERGMLSMFAAAVLRPY